MLKIPDEQMTQLKELQLSGCTIYINRHTRNEGPELIRVDVAHNNRIAPRFWYTDDGWIEGVVGSGVLRYSTRPKHTTFEAVIEKIRSFYSA